MKLLDDSMMCQQSTGAVPENCEALVPVRTTRDVLRSIQIFYRWEIESRTVRRPKTSQTLELITLFQTWGFSRLVLMAKK